MKKKVHFEYTVIVEGWDSFEKTVTEKLNQGWECIGGATIIRRENGENEVVSQTMIKKIVKSN